jgi:uncharacterized protein YbjT (DUF2867 family)
MTTGAPRRRVVVMGGTGRQGSGVLLHLLPLAERYEVAVVSRDPTSKEALALPDKYGVAAVVKADAGDLAQLTAAFAGAWGVFALTNPFSVSSRSWGLANRPTDGDADGEVRQGRNIVDACKAAGVQHLVLSSVASANDDTGIPTFESKAKVEAYLVASGVPHTILAPCGFYQNLQSPFAGIKQGVIPGLLKQGIRPQWVSATDVGWYVANAWEHPAEWLGRRLELAADKLDAWDMAAILSRLRAGEHWAVQVPP